MVALPLQSFQVYTLHDDRCRGSVVVRSLAGALLAELSPPPASVAEVKARIHEACGHPPVLQRLIAGDGRIFDDLEVFAGEECLELTLLVQESPFFTWDIAGNARRSYLAGEGGEVAYQTVARPQSRFELRRRVESRERHINVITLEPLRSGCHYFEFVVHKIGERQWCGVTATKSRATGCSNGWFYYCAHDGRHNDPCALHEGREGRHTRTFAHVTDGAVVGMALDMDRGGVVFSLDGRLQGACRVPKVPLFVTTTLDVPEDRVELRKPSMDHAPPGSLEAITKAIAEEELCVYDDSDAEDSYVVDTEDFDLFN